MHTEYANWYAEMSAHAQKKFDYISKVVSKVISPGISRVYPLKENGQGLP